MAFYGWTVPPESFIEGAEIGADGIARNVFGDPVKPEPMHLIGGVYHNTFWLLVFFGVVYYCAYLWTNYVDAACARLTRRLEDYVFEETEKSSGPLLS